jgi:adenylate cyclase
VENKLGLEYENLGEHQVKNIARPIRVYRILSYPGAAAHRVAQAKESLGKRWRKIAISAVVLIAIVGGLAYWQFYMRSPDIEPASVEKMAFPLPERPSIAVLPFVNMSEDPKQEYLSDGITEQITSTLSKVPSMFVIARTSTFAYKGKPVKVQQVSQDLGVRYILEGSVQRSEDRVRITAQLIDAIDGKHMWSKRYDRELKDIFKLQDEITLKIIRALQVKLTRGEQVNIWGKNSPSNIEYIEKVFEAEYYMNQWNKESTAKAKQLLKEAIDLEPESWQGYALLAAAHGQDVWLGTSSSPRESMGKSLELSKKAISLDDKQDFPHLVIGHIYLHSRKYDLAIKEIKQALALNPNSAEAYIYLGQNFCWSGRPEEGIESIKKGIRLSPFPNIFSSNNLAIAYREAGRYGEAIAEYGRCLKLSPNSILVYLGLSMTYALAGRFEEAREAYSELLKIDPGYSLEKALKTYPYRPERLTVIKAAFEKAGLLE